MSENYHANLAAARCSIDEADAILIGAGAGLSVAAGIQYGGERFAQHFAPFIERYGMTDMYSAGFYPFQTEEEKWAYWSKHILMNRYEPGPGQVYHDLLELVSNKPHYVITTNVDAQFEKSGFDRDKIFAVQGDYGKYQCARACHSTLYDNRSSIEQMVLAQQNCRVPSEMLPVCPQCSGPVEPNIRKDQYFVQDEEWHQAADSYVSFVDAQKPGHLVLLELGVGLNTPTIIKYPFESMLADWSGTNMIRINKETHSVDRLIEPRINFFAGDAATVVQSIVS